MLATAALAVAAIACGGPGVPEPVGGSEYGETTGSSAGALTVPPADLTREQVEERAEAGSSLAFAKLAGVDLSGSRLSGIDLEGASLDSGSLDGADFSHTNLSGASLENSSLRNTDLQGADLQGGQP